MRILLRASFAALLLAAACTGTPAAVAPTAAGDTAERPPGSTGFPALDWGAGVDDVLALHPDARRNGSGLAWTGTLDGGAATVQFVLDGDGLQQINVLWMTTFANMSDCGDALRRVRRPVDRRLGHGSEENLAVFWQLDTANVTLSCNPSDDDTARLTQTYQRKVAE